MFDYKQWTDENGTRWRRYRYDVDAEALAKAVAADADTRTCAEVIDVGIKSDGKSVLGEKYEYANWYWETDTRRSRAFLQHLG